MHARIRVPLMHESDMRVSHVDDVTGSELDVEVSRVLGIPMCRCEEPVTMGKPLRRICTVIKHAPLPRRTLWFGSKPWISSWRKKRGNRYQ